jgi:DNA polymerase III psi subunit
VAHRRSAAAPAAEEQVQQILATFAPGAVAVQQDSRLLLVWYTLAQTSRKLFPDAFAALDRAAGGAFPFTKEQVQAAHARCSADWLAWERAHDAEFALKTAQVQEEMDRAGASSLLRTRLAAIEQQKLERYQQRYEEYIRTARALAALVE